MTFISFRPGHRASSPAFALGYAAYTFAKWERGEHITSFVEWLASNGVDRLNKVEIARFEEHGYGLRVTGHVTVCFYAF